MVSGRENEREFAAGQENSACGDVDGLGPDYINAPAKLCDRKVTYTSTVPTPVLVGASRYSLSASIPFRGRK